MYGAAGRIRKRPEHLQQVGVGLCQLGAGRRATQAVTLEMGVLLHLFQGSVGITVWEVVLPFTSWRSWRGLNVQTLGSDLLAPQRWK